MNQIDWQAILDFLKAHRSEILLALAGVATFSWEWLKAAAIALMLQMEKMAREELEMGGPRKMAGVIQLFNEKYFKGMLPEYFIHYLAQKWYDEAMKD